MYQQNFSFEPPNKQIPQYLIPTPTDTDSLAKSKLIYFNQTGTMSRSPQDLSSVKIQLPDQTARPRSAVWRINFIIVFVPLLFWGFPVHLLFQKRRIYTLREWLKYLCPCTSPCLSLLTVCVAVLSVLLNIVVIYSLGKFLHVLLLTAVISEEIIDLVGDLIRILPVVVPLDLFWLRGYKLGNFIASFDRVVIHWMPMDGGKADFLQLGTGRLKLILLYGLIVCVHGLHYISEYYHDDKPNLSSQSLGNQIWQVTFVDSFAILSTLAMPIYCCFCWAIRYELAMTKEYIESLMMSKVIPNYAHFDEFKKISKKITEDVLTVNTTFSILLTVVLGLLGTYVYDEAKNLAMTIFQEVMAAIQDTTGKGFDPVRLRLLVADSVIILLYAGLLFLTYWQAVKTNDDIRAMHVWLNDFVTEPDSRLNLDLHDSYKLLKWYIHSRLEQETPALLSVMAFAFIPSLKRRLLNYRVLH